MCNLYKIKHVRTYMAYITLVSHRQVRVTDVHLRCNRTSFTKHVSIYCKSTNITLLLVVSHKISDVLTLNLHRIIDGYSQLDIITKMKRCSKNTMLQARQTRSGLIWQQLLQINSKPLCQSFWLATFSRTCIVIHILLLGMSMGSNLSYLWQFVYSISSLKHYRKWQF